MTDSGRSGGPGVDVSCLKNSVLSSKIANFEKKLQERGDMKKVYQCPQTVTSLARKAVSRSMLSC